LINDDEDLEKDSAPAASKGADLKSLKKDDSKPKKSKSGAKSGKGKSDVSALARAVCLSACSVVVAEFEGIVVVRVVVLAWGLTVALVISVFTVHRLKELMELQLLPKILSTWMILTRARPYKLTGFDLLCSEASDPWTRTRDADAVRPISSFIIFSFPALLSCPAIPSPPPCGVTCLCRLVRGGGGRITDADGVTLLDVKPVCGACRTSCM